MRLRHIEIFHAIYTTGSITNAADLLCVSQPSVSKVLAHAEMQLGFKLFERTKGKLIATTEAHMLFTEVDKIYKQLFSIKKMSKNIKRNEQGIVNIAVTPALGFQILPRAISKFKVQHPHVQFRLKTIHNEEASQALLEQNCDLAILYESPDMPQIEEVDLGISDMVIVYPKTLFPDMPKSIDIETLLQHEMVGIWDSGPLGELVWNRLSNIDLDITSSLTVDTYYVAARLVREGLGCCTIDRLTALANVDDNIGIASFTPSLRFKIKALYVDSRPLPRICTDFMQVVEDEIAAVSK